MSLDIVAVGLFALCGCSRGGTGRRGKEMKDKGYDDIKRFDSLQCSACFLSLCPALRLSATTKQGNSYIYIYSLSCCVIMQGFL